MNVTTEKIKAIPAGKIAFFPCEDGAKIRSARSLVSIIKEQGAYQKDVVDYETAKLVINNNLVFVVFAMRDCDVPTLHKLNKK
ncbi:MAG: hypothetical protein K6D91_05830 [Prevotella sp.]|nr:hypothetical protein [Prevotella sp.]